MDMFLSRQEIRRRIYAATGLSTDALQSQEEIERTNELIEQAAAEVVAECRYLNMKRRSTSWIEEDETVLDYGRIEMAYVLKKAYPSLYHPGTYGTPADPWVPTDISTLPIMNVGPQGILEVSYWDADTNTYRPLKPAHLQAQNDVDRWADLASEAQLNSVYAGDTPIETAAAVAAADAQRVQARGHPQTYELLSEGVVIWPVPDKRYVIRVHYCTTPSWMYHNQNLNMAYIDQIPSQCDALAIVYKVCGEVFAQQGDNLQTQRFVGDGGSSRFTSGKYGKRICDLRARQDTGESIALDREATMDTDNNSDERILPRWNLGPLVR